MAKKSTIPREWLRSHQKDDSLIDSVAVGALASEVLRLRQEVATRDAQIEALAPLKFESATRVELASAAPEPAETEDDAEATALYQALEYLDRHGLACLWLNREQRKAPLLATHTLSRVIAEHAQSIKREIAACAINADVKHEAIGSPLAAELLMAVQGSYHRALQPTLDEANSLLEALRQVGNVFVPEAQGQTDDQPTRGSWRVVAYPSASQENAVASGMARAREKAASQNISGEKAWDLGKSNKPAPELHFPPASGEKAWDLGKSKP